MSLELIKKFDSIFLLAARFNPGRLMNFECEKIHKPFMLVKFCQIILNIIIIYSFNMNMFN